MSTEVKNIIVALKARMDSAFKRTMDVGASAVSSMTSRAASAARGVGVAGLAIGAAGAAAGAAITAMVVRTSAGMDASGKLADRLGLSTEALARLGHAAKLADVSDLSGALDGWNKRLGQAVGGTGTAAAALKKMGLSASELAKMPMDAQLLKLSDSLAAVENPAQRAALSADLFGRAAGAQMVTLLGQGSAALQQQMGEADALGLTYSRATAAIAEAFNDNMTRVRAAVSGMATQATTALLPFFASFSERMVGWAVQVMPMVQAAITRTFTALMPVVNAFGALLQTVFAAGQTILEGFGLRVSDAGGVLGGVLDWLSAAFTTAFDAVGQIVSVFAATFSAVIEACIAILASWGVSFQGTGGVMGRVVDWIVGAFTWLGGAIIKVVTFLEALWVNWRDTLEIVWKGALLGGVVFYETLKHWFTVSLPAYLKWFGENWRALFTDIWSATKTIIGNIWTNLSGFFEGVWKWLKGEGFDFTWTGLLDGFESTVKALPEIAARTRTALEKSLTADISAAGERIGSYYTEKVTARLAKLDAGKKAAQAAADAAQKSADAAGGAAAKAASAGASAPAAGLLAPAETAAKDFGVLGRGMSLSGLVAQAATPNDAARKTADNTGRMASSLERIDRRGEAAAQSGAVAFVDGMD